MIDFCMEKKNEGMRMLMDWSKNMYNTVVVAVNTKA